MKKKILISLTVLTLVFPAYSQSFFEDLKDRAKEAWNSETRKDAWEKTKEVSSTVLSKRRYTVPITERKFINIIPNDYLLSLSYKEYHSYIDSQPISSNSIQKKQVERVAKDLISAVNTLYDNLDISEQLTDYKWEFNIIKSNTVNAFCMPGGKIVVYEGIMSIAIDDASLAIVLGHEIAHALAKHSAEQMTKGLISTVGLGAISIMISSSDMSETKKAITKLIASAGVTLTNLKFSRQNETEADRIGLIIAAMAGYNPEVAIPFWERMGKHSTNKSTHDWFSTHPSNQNRINNLKSFISEANEYYVNK